MRTATFLIKFLFLTSTCLALLNIYFVATEFHKNYSSINGNIFPNSKIIGGDYIAFFSGAALFIEDPANLYSHTAQKHVQEKIAPTHSHTSGFLPFVYPPLVAGFFASISTNSFITSYFIWLAISSTFYLSGIFLILRILELPRTITLFAIMICAGFPPFFLKTLMGGQSGAIGVLLCSILYYLLSTKSRFSSGVVASFFYYKPPMFILLVLWAALHGSWKFIAGFLVSGVILVILSVYSLPLSSLNEYMNLSLNYSYGSVHYDEKLSVPHKGAGFYAIISSYLDMPVNGLRLVLLSVIMLTVVYLKKLYSEIAIKSSELFTLSFCIALISSLFFSVHILDYDLSLNIIPLMLILGTLFRQNMKIELLSGLLFLILFQMDMIIPDIRFPNYSLSAYGFVQGTFLLYAAWVYHRLKVKIVTPRSDNLCTNPILSAQ